MTLVADVAIPVPLAHAFSYEVPAEFAGEVRPGARVLCEFGRRKLVGVVLAVAEREPPPPRRPPSAATAASAEPMLPSLEALAEAPRASALKKITALVDADPVLPEELLGFLRKLAEYYFAPIGEVLRLALPALERDQVLALSAAGDAPEARRQVGGRKVAFARPTDLVEAPGSLRGQAAAILALLRATGEQPVARLEERFGNARAAVKKLGALGLATVELREPPRDPFFSATAARDTPPELNEAQALAAARIEAALAAPPGDAAARAFLLFGVTGSGKTEVYLRAIAACLAKGQGALVMVPEIALTPQLVSRFRARFGDALAVLHSALGDADRHAMWTSLRRGEVKVAIGARSALFAPVPDLGLVLVDEEHDASFKQEEGVRYHARDMALLRAHRQGAVVVLGSATPSLESVGLCRRGKLEELALPDRAVREASLPAVTIVDIRRIGAGPTGDKLISLPLYRALEKTLAAKEQAILFLNRRGFAPSVLCDACGAVETCLACSVALTYHRVRGGRMRCHYCDYEAELATNCSSCRAPSLVLEGLGTERLEATVAAAFPGARVARLDRDVASGARSEAIIETMRAGDIDVLVGTQMVTKGHDLPNVTLVGVVNADAALSLPDFRASERGFQLLVQVAGRAGRRERPGKVLIQTRSPEHIAIQFAAKHDVRGFLSRELEDRGEVGYPPFTRLALLRVDAPDEDLARAVASRLAATARTSKEGLARQVDVLGPAAAPIARLRGRFRFRVLLRAKERGPLRGAILAVLREREGIDRRARAVVDVDPVSML
jgi:primosomal protein N' (replication factor Y) (superfamily II helicase)